VGWKLCTNMGADDVSATLDIALTASGCENVTALHKPRLLSDNGPCCVARVPRRRHRRVAIADARDNGHNGGIGRGRDNHGANRWVQVNPLAEGYAALTNNRNGG
jgi:transposase InsO family protein